jgi:mannosyltransferase
MNDTSPRRRWTTTAVLIGVVLVGFLVRAWRVTLPGLTSDEAFSWRLTRHPLGEMLGRAALDVHPPLYYLVLDGWLSLFGDGPAALRGLSVLAGLLVVPLAFLLVLETARLDDGGQGRCAAGMLAASMIALHATQVMQSRNARMYALGTALATASAWLLLRAHLSTGRRYAWWALWGLAAAAAVGTHYYLAFTVLAQAAWAIGAAPDRRARVRELVLAGLVALAALAPWLPVFWRQARQVQAAYWIPAATAAALTDAIARWALAVDAGRVAPLAVGLVAASLVAAARAGRAGRFFAVQAVMPWVLGLALSTLTGRPIVLERYMVFAQVFLLCAWAVTVAKIQARRWRIGAAAAILLLLSVTLLRTTRRFPSQPPALAGAARALRRNAVAGDLVVVESPRVLNKVRYYAAREDARDLDVRAALPERIPLSPYVSHVVSLLDSEVIPADAVFASGARTVWIGRESTSPPVPAPAGWTITFARIFEGGDDSRFLLARYDRAVGTP